MNKQLINTIRYISEKIYVIIFVIIIGIGLISSVLILTDIINKSSSDNDSNTSNRTIEFSQEALNYLDTLKTSSENTVSTQNNSGRINPFAE